MAKAIITCAGETITIGDKVRTPDGRIIRVEGAAIGKMFYNAEACTKVADEVPTTREVEGGHGEGASKAATMRASDCIVWGG